MIDTSASVYFNEVHALNRGCKTPEERRDFIEKYLAFTFTYDGHNMSRPVRQRYEKYIYG